MLNIRYLFSNMLFVQITTSPDALLLVPCEVKIKVCSTSIILKIWLKHLLLIEVQHLLN